MLALDRDGPVALVTLSRPDKRNALSIELRRALAGALGELAGDDGVRCAVLTGAGSAFSSGMDTTQFGGDVENRRRLVDSTVAAFGAVMSFPKPLLAAVNGPALAGGFALALECDLRVAARSARFGFAELPRG
ncbi:MAG: enoyl-CoA hydratase/isomerase family protein, partial [Actinomycetota bacterium]|nr:enoyl-CoA hydratase/isomerase family protein [Actinomycetota bacterium]